MRAKIRVLWFAFAWVSTTSFSQDVTEIFRNVANRKSAVLTKLEPCKFGTKLTKEVSEWIGTNLEDLSNDLYESPHSWTSELAGALARTASNPKAPIEFGYAECSKILDQPAEIERTLIEQSVIHRAKGKSKAFVKLVVDAITETSPYIDPNSLFNSNYCTSPALTEDYILDKKWITPPKQLTANIGTFSVETRGRFRRSIEGATWTDWGPLITKTSGIISVGGSPLSFTEELPLPSLFVSELPFAKGTIILSFRGNETQLYLFGRFRKPIVLTGNSHFVSFVTDWLRLQSEGDLKAEWNAFVDPKHVPIVLQGASSSKLTGHVGTDCIWFQIEGKFPALDLNQNCLEVENQIVFVGKTDGAKE